MAERYVALLRGINVGRAKRIAMADLRAVVESLGHRDVRTLLNSGNVVFSGRSARPAAVAAAIERAVAAELGVASRVTVLPAAELARVVEENALADAAVAADPSRLLVAVPADAAGCARLAPLAERDWAPEALHLGARAAYLWCAGGILESRLPAEVGRLLGDAVTTRNWATVGKLHALATG